MNEDTTGSGGFEGTRPSRPMYRMLGADGREYGPVTAEQLRLWIAEGRANAQTRVSLEGSTDWKPLAEWPEFASALGPAPAPGGGSTPPPYQPMGTPGGPVPMNRPAPDAASQVNGPAVGLIIVAILNIVSSGVSVLMQLGGVRFMEPMEHSGAPWMPMFTGTVAVLSSVLTAALAVIILLGGMKMQKLENHGLAVTASILALLPCTSPCCLVGLPIGIWALVVLFRPEVKNAFH